MNHTLFLILFFSIQFYFIKGQPQKPIKWTTVVPRHYKIGDTIQIQFRAEIKNGWYMYSTDTDSVEYITPALFSLKENVTLSPIGKIISLNSKERYFQEVKSTVKIMEAIAILQQKVVVKRKPIRFKATVDYKVLKTTRTNGWLIPYIEKFTYKEVQK